VKEFLHLFHSLFFFIDPPLKFFAGLAGTAVAGAIPIPGISDGIGNIVKQGIQMGFGDHKFDVDDFKKDVIMGAGMGAVKGLVNPIKKKIGASKSLVFFLFLFFFF